MKYLSSLLFMILISNTFTFMLSYNPNISPNNGPLLNIVTTTEIIASIVDFVGFPYVNTTYVLPEGADIHEYSLSPIDVKKIEMADLIVLINSSFFSLEKEIREYAEEYGKLILDYNNYSMEILSVPNFGKNFHGIWLYPDNAYEIANATYRTLCMLLPEKAEVFRHNIEEFKRKIDALKNFLIEISTNLGIIGKNAVVAVPGVAYVVESFGMHVIGTLMKGPGITVSPSKLSEYIQRAKNGQIVFIACPEHLKNTKIGELAKEFSNEANIPIVYFRIFSIGDLKDYFALMTYNAAMLNNAFSKTKYSTSNYDIFYLLIFVLIAIILVEGIIIWRYRKYAGE